jgi:alpha-beta hydrolase superfamily lysophospholipase
VLSCAGGWSQEIKKYVEDPLNFVGDVRVRSARQFQAGMHALKSKYSTFTLPIYGHHGSCDRCTSMKAHQAFVDAVRSEDKQMNVVEGGYHELIMVRLSCAPATQIGVPARGASCVVLAHSAS